MNPKDFRCPEAGRVIRTPEKYHAFIPAPLPPAIPYDAELALALSRADAALSELSGLGRLLPNPHLLIAPYIRREAVLSSRIEGTRASLSDILLDEMEAEVPDGDEADVREVRNYVAALEHGVKRLRTLPLSLRLVRELHARLMKGVRGDRATPGEFRRSQNWIGPRGSTPVTASYVPPPPAPMQQSLARWERFLHERDKHPDLIQCALMHEHFEAIHPFLDGNGRVGRLLITLFLIERGRLSQPLLYLSAYIEAHRQDYYDLLQRVRTHCDWTRWLLFFLTGVTETARDAIQRADDLMALREKFRGRLKDKPKAITLLDELFLNPYITVARAAKILEVSNPTARQTVSLLERTGMLKEISGRKWGQLYLAGPIMRVIEKAGE
ncbi:cell division protein Fic [Sulfuricaulis limicola]|uniref:Protein adenylyltransferase n=1 Tax=Sulfuricaulis limicola TaxID=1620215 RepID=A0A1B4XFZ0_9GAMM|nr:cell division protein Fic [Sulfuricaulis limicola]